MWGERVVGRRHERVWHVDVVQRECSRAGECGPESRLVSRPGPEHVNGAALQHRGSRLVDIESCRG